MLKKITRYVAVFVATAIIAFAVLLNTARLLTPLLDHHKHWVAVWIAQRVGGPVSIRQINASWLGFQPAIQIQGLSVQGSQLSHTPLTVEQFTVALDWIHSLWAHRWLPGRLAVKGVSFDVVETAQGQWQVNGQWVIPGRGQASGSSPSSDLWVWLLTQSHIRIRDLNIAVTPLGKKTFLWRSIQLDLNNREGSKGQHHWVMQAQLEQAQPTTLKVVGNFTSFPFFSRDASASWYVEAQEVVLPQWFSAYREQFHLKKWECVNGLASFKLWAHWRQGQWSHGQALLQVSHVGLVSPDWEKQLFLDRLSANVDWHHTDRGWKLSADHLKVSVNHRRWPDSQFLLVHTDMENSPSTRWQLGFNYMRLSDIEALLENAKHLPLLIQPYYVALKPRGLLKNVVLEWESGEEFNVKSIKKLSGEFLNLGWEREGKIPGIKGLWGELHYDGQAAHFNIHSLKYLDGRPWLVKPLVWQQVKMRGSASMSSNGWTLSLPEWQLTDGNIQVSGKDLIVDQNAVDKKIKLNVTAQFSMLHLEQLKDYLSSALGHEALPTWLSFAFHGGSISNGTLAWQGRLSDWPYQDKTGHFDLHLKTQGVDLQYDRAWPLIHQVNAQLDWHNQNLHIQANSAMTEGVQLKQIQAELIDSTKGVLRIQGGYEGDLERGRDFLMRSPLEVGKQLSHLTMRGPFSGQLQLEIPLKTQSKTAKVQGKVALKNTEWGISGQQITLKKVTGTFDYGNDYWVGHSVNASLWGAPTHIQVQTLKRHQKVSVVQIMLQGRIPLASLNTTSFSFLHWGVTGALPYHALLALYPDAIHHDNTLSITSDLRGTRVDWPSPLGKLAHERCLFQIDLRLKRNEVTQWALRYKKILSAALQISTPRKTAAVSDPSVTSTPQDSHREQVKPAIISGEIRLGPGRAHFQHLPGLVLSVHWPLMHGDVWQSFFQKKWSDVSSVRPMQWRLVHGSIDKLVWFDSVWNHVTVTVQPKGKAWAAIIRSNELAGEVSWPWNLQHRAVDAKIQYFHYQPSQKADRDEKPLDPMKLPAMTVEVAHFFYKGKEMGRLKGIAERVEQGLRLSHLSLKSPLMQLEAKGQWIHAQASTFFETSGQMFSANWGNMLRQWRLTDVLVGGNGSMGFHLKWPGGLRQFRLSKATGEMNAEVRDGRIVKLSEKTESELGLGKMLNLLSLQSLPQRLLFNFSDLTQKGFDFSDLRGVFVIKQGEATTAGTLMQGSVARVEMQGGIHLADERYHLQLTITPHMTGSLPVLATLTGGPIIGAFTWLLDKVLVSRTVGQAVQLQYRVAGTWNHPIIQKVG